MNNLNFDNNLSKYDDLICQITKFTNSLGLYIVGKIKLSLSISSSITNGILNNFLNFKELGIGFHLFNSEGYSTFLSTSNIDLNNLKKMILSGANLLKNFQKYYNEPNKNIFELNPIKARLLKNPEFDLNNLNSSEFQNKFLNFYKELPIENSLSYNIGISLKYNETFIFRSDGTNILYNDFYSVITGDISKSDNSKGSLYYKVHKFGVNVIDDNEKLNKFIKLTNKNNSLVKKIAEADMIDAGNYNIIIDYALAKGLAHEAFGHAAETDSIENSILAKDKKFNKGLVVGKPYLNIIDESFDNEWAYSPFSDYGGIRQRVHIVKEGILNCGLSDIFSYKKANTLLTNAERSESYSDIPIPRMSNIRIELDENSVYKDKIFDKDFDDIEPENVLEYAYNNNLFNNDKEIVLLSGYKGGQVDTVKGNFVFNCQAIYKKEGNKIKIFKPSIFSGSTLKTLNSISFGIGDLKLDAIGRCGKSGQSVNSSGGSHYYIGINYNDQIIIGGKK